MIDGQKKLVENYNSLLRQLEKDDTLFNISMVNVIRFCSLFQSDDVELFKEFAAICESPSNERYGGFSRDSISRIFNLFIKRFDLADYPDKEAKALRSFICVAIKEGFLYHLGSSANFASIMKYGLGIEAIGLKTEERIDYEKLLGYGGKKLLPFAGSKDNKLFYSSMPILGARYGDRPEWLMELELNKSLVKSSEKELLDLVGVILNKYTIKYEGAHRMLFLIPFQSAISLDDDVDDMLDGYLGMSSFDIFRSFWQLLEQKNCSTYNYIPSSSILAIDLLDYSMWMQDGLGNTVKVVDGKRGNKFSK